MAGKRSNSDTENARLRSQTAAVAKGHENYLEGEDIRLRSQVTEKSRSITVPTAREWGSVPAAAYHVISSTGPIDLDHAAPHRRPEAARNEPSQSTLAGRPVVADGDRHFREIRPNQPRR